MSSFFNVYHASRVFSNLIRNIFQGFDNFVLSRENKTISHDLFSCNGRSQTSTWTPLPLQMRQMLHLFLAAFLGVLVFRKCLFLVTGSYFHHAWLFVRKLRLTIKNVGEGISGWHSVSTIIFWIMKLHIGPVTCPKSAVLVRGRRLRANTAVRGPVTGPIRSYLINNVN